MTNLETQPRTRIEKAKPDWQIARENLRRLDLINGTVVNLLPILENHLPHHAHYPNSSSYLLPIFVQSPKPYDPDPYAGYLQEHRLEGWDMVENKDMEVFMFQPPNEIVGVTPPRQSYRSFSLD